MIQYALMTALLLCPAHQDVRPPAKPPVAASPVAPVATVAAATADVLLPGALPADADPAAAARWKALCSAVSPKAGGERLRAFDLEFEGRAFPTEGAANDFDIKRFLYLDPGWVRMTLKSGRVRLRGPQGDFMLDTKRGTSMRLRGKELAADIRELNETVRIARSFVALTDPSNIRIASLRLGEVPTGLPAKLAERAATLEWIELASPDFHPEGPSAVRDPATPEPLFRVRIGCGPKTHLPALAVIQEATGGEPRIETAMLLDLRKFKRLDGYQVPGHVRTHLPDASVSPWVFAGRQSMELWLVKGSLAPVLSEDDFLPPRK